MGINKNVREFANGFAESVIARDYVSAHRMLAPWLRESMTAAALEQAIMDEVEETVEINELEGEYHPRGYEIDYNICSLEDLKTPRSYADDREIAPEVTADNFRQWMVIQFQPAEEEELDIDAYVDFWMIVVELNGEYKIGYFEMQDPD